jgi:hypothetical protein
VGWGSHRTSATLTLYPPLISWSHVGLNPGICAEKLISHHLSYGTALERYIPLYVLSKPQATDPSFMYIELYFFLFFFCYSFVLSIMKYSTHPAVSYPLWNIPHIRQAYYKTELGIIKHSRM